MREYTIRFYLDTLEIIEFKLTAKSMLSAEAKALKKYNDNYGWWKGRIMYMSTEIG